MEICKNYTFFGKNAEVEYCRYYEIDSPDCQPDCKGYVPTEVVALEELPF